MSPCLAIVIFLCSSQLVRVAAYRLTMVPDYVRIPYNTQQSVSFTCTADVPLTGCQFRWRNYDGYVGPLLELSRGSLSRADSTHLDTALTGYSYSGGGLGSGDCGVTMQVKGYKTWMVACRVRAESGGWTYAWADMHAERRVTLPHTRTPRESVVLPGGEARFALKAEEPLDTCYVYPPGLGTLDFDQGAKSAHSTGRHRYLGAGLAGGECGLALANVGEADNGPVRYWIRNTAETKRDSRFMALIVARTPSAPTLSVVYTDAGVTATCVVHEGRPIANISWVMGDDVVRQDENDDSPGKSQDEWRWPWMQGSVLQRLTLTLQAKDNGKVLKCLVSHVTLARSLEATEIISFTEPTSATTPVPTPSTLTCHNASIGSTPDPTCTASSMLGLLCQEYRVRASLLENTSCPKDEVYEFRVREARAAARTAELVEEQAKFTLEAAKADEESKAMLAKVALDAAKAEEASKAIVTKVVEEQAKVALEAAKAEEASKAVLANIALEAAKAEEASKAMLAKVALEAAKAEEASKAIVTKLVEEQAKVALEAAKAEEASNAVLANIALEAAKSSAKAEEARAREEEAEAVAAELAVGSARAHARAEEAWASNAEEELKFERERRSPSLQQSLSPQSVQG